METTTFHSIFTLVGIMAAFLSAFSFLGTWWTGKIIDNSNKQKIQTLQQEIIDSKPSIYSQSSEKINIVSEKLFKHIFSVSVDSPKSNMLIYTELSSKASKIGKLKLEKTGNSGVRERNGTLIPFEDFLCTFKTDVKLNMETDKIIFSAEPEENSDYLIYNYEKK